ncbi:MAG: hypothetical protein QME52_05995 [Bacteroidota bacterium]|nr:hypothetical protein [Bacteroidota bacterium]
MGSNSIFGVLALMFFFTVINSSMNERDKHAADETYGYIKYTYAREIARSAINIALKKVSDSVSIKSVSGKLDGGTYTVSISKVDSFMDLTSTAKFNDTIYNIQTKLLVFSKPFPKFRAAVGLHVEDVGFGIVNGKNKNPATTINGYNHDTSGNRLYDSLGVPGVSVIKASDTAKILTPPYPNQIDGTKDANYDPELPNPAKFADLYIAQADTIISATKPINSNATFGSYINPAIVYIDGGPDTNSSVKINGNLSGWGILVIHGNTVFNGNLTWKGLVIVYGETAISFSASSGNATIIGSILMGGASGSEFSTNGSVAFKYSTETLENGQNIGKLLAYRIIDWYE